MDFFNLVNAGLVGAIIVLLETVKRLLKEIWKIDPPVWVWKVAVLVAGVPAALIAGRYASWREALTGMFIYSAAATLLYQTGKMAISGILDKKNE